MKKQMLLPPPLFFTSMVDGVEIQKITASGVEFFSIAGKTFLSMDGAAKNKPNTFILRQIVNGAFYNLATACEFNHDDDGYIGLNFECRNNLSPRGICNLKECPLFK